MDFGERLSGIRRKRGLTQEQLAKRVGVSRVHIARLETNRHDPPLSTVRALAKALRVKVGALVD